MNQTYPFIPKSTAYLEEGHIISIPLSNGQYGCARVLQFKMENGKRGRTQFIIGLMNWRGDSPPECDSIARSKIIDHGQVHVRAIKVCSSEVVGFCRLSDNDHEIPLSLSQSPGNNCWLRRGYNLLRLATTEEQEKYSVFSTWGLKVLNIMAEKYLVP